MLRHFSTGGQIPCTERPIRRQAVTSPVAIRADSVLYDTTVKPIQIFTVVPSLPPSIEALRSIAYNLRWSWNHETIELFRRLDRDLWETAGHNPVLMLGTIEQHKLEQAAEDEAFLAHLRRVEADLDAYMSSQPRWFDHVCKADSPRPLIAYFSAEFGITE